MANEVEVDIDIQTKEAEKKLKKFVDAIGRIEGIGKKAFGELDKSTEKTKKKVDLVSKAFASFKGNLAAIATSKGLAAVASFFRDAAQDAIDFDRALREINTILPKNARLTTVVINELKDLSREFGTSRQAQAKSFYQIVSAGITDTVEATQLLTTANKLSLGGISDITSSVDLLTDIINVYGKENITAADAADSLFTTVRLGKTTVSQLTSSLGQVLPSAEKLGVSLNVVGAALAELTTKGLTTSERTTQLNALFTALFRNSADASKNFGKKVGDAFSLTALRTKGLATFLEDLIVATDGSETTLQKLLGRTEAVKAVFGLTGGGVDSLRKKIEQYGEAAKGAADAAAKEQEGGLGFVLGQLNQQILALITPSEKFISILTEGAKALRDFAKEANKSIETQFIDESKNVGDLTRELTILENKLKAVNESSLRGSFVGDLLLADTEELAQNITEIQNRIAELNTEESQSQVTDLNNRLNEIRAQQKDPLFADLFGGADNLKEQEAEILQQLENIELQRILSGERTIESESAKNDKLKQDAIDSEKNKFDAIAEIQAAQKEIDNEIVEQEKLEKELVGEEDFVALEESLGRENALRELARIQDLDSESQRQAALITLLNKADKERSKKQKEFRKAQLKLDQTFFAQKISIAQNSAQLLTAIIGKENQISFAIQKGAALATVGLNAGKALAAVPAQTAHIPFPGNIAAGATLTSLIKINAGIQAAAITASAIQGFQRGGVVGGIPTTSGRDNQIARVASGEVILNQRQQANTLFGIANGGGAGGGGGNNVNITFEGGIFGTTAEQVDFAIGEINDAVEFRNQSLRTS